jgi:urease accessory protein
VHDAVAPGTGRLTFTCVGGRTVVRTAYATSPLKLINPRNHGQAAWVYLASYGGGLVGGDALRLDVEVERGARGLIATQASTKVYRSTAGASHALHARVRDEGLLVVAPDPVVCFAASTYRQEQRFDLSPRGSLAVIDWISAGRLASGERWAFDSYRSRLTIWRDARCVLHDAMSLVGEDGPVPERLGRFSTLLVAALAGPALADRAAELRASIAALPIERAASLILSAAPMGDDGAIVRMAGTSVEEVTLEMRRRFGFLGALLGDDPWARKW